MKLWRKEEEPEIAGVPLSEWDEYNFEFQDDLTAKELALFLQNVHQMNPGWMAEITPLPNPLNIRRGKESELTWMTPVMWRHLRKVEK